MWVEGGAAALVARGYNALAFDGPGQGASLFLQHLYFRPDWEHVITPVVDYLLTRADVDADRIAITGVSQGGYWVPRAVAFEHRIAAAVADPGVFDVAHFVDRAPPAQHAPTHRDGRAGEVRPRHGVRREGLEGPPRHARLPRPPVRSHVAVRDFRAVQEYTLEGVVEQIECPMLILDPEGEQFWPGQSQRLYDALTGPEVDHAIHRRRGR